MENYHHSVGQPQTDLHRPRVPSADEEIVDGPAAAKRSRTSEAVKSVRKQMVDDSLLSHMTHVAGKQRKSFYLLVTAHLSHNIFIFCSP
jgi:hypothetical protein